MNVADIKSRVRRTFGDESAVQVTDADLFKWISDAQLEIIRQNEGLLQSSALASSVVGQMDYPLSVITDLFTVKTVLYNSIKLKGLTLQQFEEYLDGWQNTQLYGNGTPQVYMVYNNVLSLFPPPDTATANVIKIYYSKKPTSITSDSDPLTLPEVYHPTIVKYCLIQAYEMDEDWNAFNAKSQQFVNDVNTLRDNEELNQRIYYPAITLLPEDC